MKIEIDYGIKIIIIKNKIQEEMKVVRAFMIKKYSPEELREILTYVFSKTDIKEITYKQFINKIIQWMSYIKGEKTLSNLITNPEESLDRLKSVDTIKQTSTNHHLYLSAVICFITHILMKNKCTMGIKSDTLVSIADTCNKWRELLKINWAPIQEHYDSNEPTQKQKDKIVPFDILLERLAELPEGSSEHLLLAFYTKVEPVRADYFATELVEDNKVVPTEENYIIMSESKLVIQAFKASHTCPKIENILSTEVMGWIRRSLIIRPRKYLFTMPTEDKPFSRVAFSNWACRTLTRLFKKPMNLTVLRHIYITHKIEIKTPINEMKELAKNMGHSRTAQRMYDWNQTIHGAEKIENVIV